MIFIVTDLMCMNITHWDVSTGSTSFVFKPIQWPGVFGRTGVYNKFVKQNLILSISVLSI
jgi:hypothetical protein